MNVLVTGGAGYIGSHTCKLLASAHLQPVVYDNLSNGRRDMVRWGPLVEGDLHDSERLRQTLVDHRIEAVIHFAAFAYVGESLQDPERYYRNNVAGTLSLLRAMQAAAVGKLVFSSTCAVYGAPQRLPLTENHPHQPVSPYGASKMMVERMLRDFSRAHRIASVSLRYFNAAGADPDGELGEVHDPETHLIPLALAAAAGRGRLMVHGTDYPTADGTCVRDYIHVADLAQAHRQALVRLHQGVGGSTAYNLGCGNGFSVREVLHCVEKVCGAPVQHDTGPRREGDPPILVADATAARRDLQWEPRYTRLDDIVSSAWRWHRGRWQV